MIKKKMVAGGTKKSAKKPCPPFCGESAKEKLSTTSAKIATGVITAGAAAMGATGLAKRNKAIKAEQEKAKKEGKELTRKEARKKVLGKASSGGTMKKYAAGGMTTKKKMAAGGMSMGTKQCGPGDGSCKEVKSGNIFQRWGDKMRRNKANNFNKPKLRRTKV